MYSFSILAFLFLLFCANPVAAQLPSPLEEGLSGRSKTDTRVTRYVAPTRIVWKTPNVVRAERLLDPGEVQLTTAAGNICVLDNTEGGASAILLDFGKELQGGILLAAANRTRKTPVKVRIRLGESVSEAMSETGEASTATNDHAMRDFVLEVPWLGQVEIGNSGFRFVRIDLAEPNVRLPLHAVRAAFRYRDIPYLGSFRCDDERLNEIWRTGAYTVHLNMQDYVWDGIKRDRLVWLGDLHPELMTICTVFGETPVLNATLDFGRDHQPLPGWMNGMCSYSLWWIISQRDLYMYQGDHNYLEQQHDYLKELTDQLISEIDGNAERLSGHRFLDWPTSRNKRVIHAGLQSLMRMALDAAGQMGEWLGDAALMRKCADAADRLARHVPEHDDNKQAAALLALSGLEDAVRMNDEVLRVGGARGFSTFYGYYMLEAMARAGAYDQALEIISDYWGAMLDLGATTFWEDLEYEHALKAARIDEIVPEGAFDIHAQSGDFCYEGFRHSFCHGWASGPTPWLTEHVLGVRPLQPGCRTLCIEPHLGRLKWAEGTFPTPCGVVEIKHTLDAKGGIVTHVRAPRQIRIVQGATISEMTVRRI